MYLIRVPRCTLPFVSGSYMDGIDIVNFVVDFPIHFSVMSSNSTSSNLINEDNNNQSKLEDTFILITRTY